MSTAHALGTGDAPIDLVVEIKTALIGTGLLTLADPEESDIDYTAEEIAKVVHERIRIVESARDEWARQCNMASEAQSDAVSELSTALARVKELEDAGNEVDRSQWKSSAERAHAMANLATVLERKMPVPRVSGGSDGQ